jgi:hypothetical protein
MAGLANARYDKTVAGAGLHRVRLAAAWPSSDQGLLYGVGLDATGKAVKGAGTTGIMGVICLAQAGAAAGDVVDMMTHGEIADFHFLNDAVTATIAGTVYYLDATTGAPTVTATANKKMGVLLEKTVHDRLIVNIDSGGTGA